MLSDAITLSLSKVSEMGDEELEQCNKVRVVIAFISWFLVLASAYNILFGGIFILIFLIAAVFTINSALAFMEVLDRKKKNQNGETDSNNDLNNSDDSNKQE